MRKLNWKKVIAGTLSAVMLLSVTACGSANGKNESASTESNKKNLTKITFCLDWTPNTNHTGIYAANCACPDAHIVAAPFSGGCTISTSSPASS